MPDREWWPTPPPETFDETAEPWMSERDQEREMDGRAADWAAYEPDLDEWGRWA